MATKRGKTLTAKKLLRRATKKAKRYARRLDARINLMNSDLAKREAAKKEE